MPGDEFSNAIEVLTGSGIPRLGARLFVRELQGPVTDGLCLLLPGVTSTSAGEVMGRVSIFVLKSAPGLLSKLEPDLFPQHYASALQPTMWMVPIGMELVSRRSSGPSSPVPSPTLELRECRDQASELVDNILGMYITGERRTEFQAALVKAASAIAVTGPGGDDTAWGGWSMLAATALTARSTVLPRPGRPRPRFPWNRSRAGSAGFAYTLGTVFVQAAALTLIEDHNPS